MASADAWDLLIVLAFLAAAWLTGAAWLWLWDQLCILAGWRVHPDTCLSCGRRLRRIKGRRTYRPHRCRERY